MEKSESPDIQQLAKDISQASQKIMQSYIEKGSQHYYDSKDIADTYSAFSAKLISNPEVTGKIQVVFKKYLSAQQELCESIATRQLNQKKEYKPVITPAENDKRFLAPEWNESPYFFDFVKQSYLLASRLMNEIIDTVDIEDKAKNKLSFYTKQYIDAFSPANFIATNPEALKLAQQTNGKSLLEGFKNLISDAEKGIITQTDMSSFEPGKNIAITKGAVVFENELIQLIQYTPTTPKVYEKPLLIIPPWINKYYILDLRQENSFARFLIDKGFSTYMISWKNPTSEMSDVSLDDYVSKGSLKAMEVVQSISKAKKINVLGYCLGGTLLGVTLSILAKQKDNPINTATFLAAMIDFSDVGPMGDIIDHNLIKRLEDGPLLKDGLMHGHNMEEAFNLIRANDLIWSYVVNNYLKGKTPTSFDVMYWTNDNTNLPANMYLYYLKNMVMNNKLSRKNALRICNTPVDIGKIEIPCYVIGLMDDHISPAHTVFTTTELVSGPVEFILGGSGHVMGAVNPPAKKRYGYYTGGKLENGLEVWKESSKFHEGSWWTYWSENLMKKSGKQITAVKQPGSSKYKVIEPAPGRYVKEKC